MERESYENKVGTILDSNDINRMTQTLFKPALKHCDVDTSQAGMIVYSKESLDDDAPSDVAIDHYFSFHAMQDPETRAITYGISEEITENITLDQLDDDDCNQIRHQFQQQYVAAGRHIVDLTADPTWNALYAPEIFNHVTLSLSLTTSYMFQGNHAVKTFAAERRLRVAVGANNEDMPVHYDTVLNAFHFDDKPLGLDEQVCATEGWPPEFYAGLDNASDAMLMMTTKDREHVMLILNELQFLPRQKSSERFQGN